ncbi:hypothetical protein KHP62_07020 [Rhodobacteraceae bacterium NNCM2]|nr:hypothetical protein [Coraliihabitans acroporae]
MDKLNCTVSELFGALFSVLHEWQTLIAGLLALTAASLTIRTMEKQIRIDVERHKNAAEMKKLAVRAQLPDALSGLVQHIKKVVECLLREHNVEELTSPIEHIEVLKNSIEFIDRDASQGVFRLVSFYQVWHSRINGGSRSSLNYLESSICDSVLLMFYAKELFEYGRNESDDVSLLEPTNIQLKEVLAHVAPLDTFWENQDKLSPVYKLIDEICPD